MAIRQRPMGTIKLLGGVGRVVRKARLAPGVKEVKTPRQAWRIR